MADGALSAGDRLRIETALSDLGYELVPLRLLHRMYDGATWLADDVPGAVVGRYGQPGQATWWTRFFDKLDGADRLRQILDWHLLPPAAPAAAPAR
ncbi:hypothetical protein ACFVYD_10700 [Streptomyces sp. NPDC058301]|uniref:hypothetical protein n=1 Tax=Streptomyces sp. NPDC058301 TaxID=3346436 RepID=UPI0036ECD11B